MKAKFLILSKFTNEYDFLERRLRYYATIEQILCVPIQTHLLIESHFWSGEINEVDIKQLTRLKKTFTNFSYDIITHNQRDLVHISRRCREDLANCYLAQTLQTHNFSNYIYILSDLDEIIDLSGFRSLIHKKSANRSSYNIPYYFSQRTVWFTTRYTYREHWMGPVAFLQCPNPSIAALCQNSRHLPDTRSYTLESGFHLSYLKSTISSKLNNSHGLKYFYVRLFMALIGIHPFRRRYKGSDSKHLTVEQKFLLSFFEDLSFQFSHLLSSFSSNHPL